MRPSLLLALALLATGPLRAARHAASAPSGAPFDVRVTRGRGTLVQGEDLRALLPSSGRVAGHGPGALGLGSAGLGELGWRSRASLELAGPAELEWSTPGAGGDLEIVVGVAARLDLEARRGGVALELSHGWSLEVRGAALQVRGEPDGGWSVRHHGGEPVRVRSRVPRPDGSWPRRILPGDSVRLAARP